MSMPHELSELIERFDRNREAYLSGQYNETQLRREFLSDPTDKSRHKKMIGLVEQILSLNKQLAAAKTDNEKISLQRQIDATDRQIDQLVYELYGLKEEEIRIVKDNN